MPFGRALVPPENSTTAGSSIPTRRAYGFGARPAFMKSAHMRIRRSCRGHGVDPSAAGDVEAEALGRALALTGGALAAQPRLLLLDEPMAGMNQDEKRAMSRFIRAANRAFGATVVLIEHDIGVVMDVSDHIVALDYGKKIADGEPDTVRHHPEVIAAYLGAAH